MILLASDLDQTLIYSRRSADADIDTMTCVEHHEGRPLSYITTGAAHLLTEMGDVPLVPTTTRMLRQYRRVRLPIDPEYAIAANGGHLLIKGEVDPKWAAHIGELQAADPVTTYKAAAAMSAALGSVATSIRFADDLFVFAVVDLERLTDDMTAQLRQWAEDSDWSFSLQRRKVYLVPDWLAKESAVAEVAERTGADLVLAAGDSLLDRGMLALADHAIRPAHGELHRIDHRAPSLQVTSSSGIAAGEEILRWSQTFTVT